MSNDFDIAQAAADLLGESNPLERCLDSIVWGDCLHVMRELPSGCVDMVLTDPPYLAGYASRDGRTLDNDESDEWLAPAFREIHRLLKRDSFCVSFYGWSKVDTFMRAWRAAGFQVVGHFVATKGYSSAKKYVAYCHESAYLLVKGRPAMPADPIRDLLPWKYTGNTLHPTQKPEETLVPLVRSFSPAGGVVLDPFAGSGTTAAVALKLGRHFIGMEYNQGYARIAQQRLDAIATARQKGVERAA